MPEVIITAELDGSPNEAVVNGPEVTPPGGLSPIDGTVVIAVADPEGIGSTDGGAATDAVAGEAAAGAGATADGSTGSDGSTTGTSASSGDQVASPANTDTEPKKRRGLLYLGRAALKRARNRGGADNSSAGGTSPSAGSSAPLGAGLVSKDRPTKEDFELMRMERRREDVATLNDRVDRDIEFGQQQAADDADHRRQMEIRGADLKVLLAPGQNEAMRIVAAAQAEAAIIAAIGAVNLQSRQQDIDTTIRAQKEGAQIGREDRRADAEVRHLDARTRVMIENSAHVDARREDKHDIAKLGITSVTEREQARLDHQLEKVKSGERVTMAKLGASEGQLAHTLKIAELRAEELKQQTELADKISEREHELRVRMAEDAKEVMLEVVKKGEIDNTVQQALAVYLGSLAIVLDLRNTPPATVPSPPPLHFVPSQVRANAVSANALPAGTGNGSGQNGGSTTGRGRHAVSASGGSGTGHRGWGLRRKSST